MSQTQESEMQLAMRQAVIAQISPPLREVRYDYDEAGNTAMAMVQLTDGVRDFYMRFRLINGVVVDETTIGD